MIQYRHKKQVFLIISIAVSILFSSIITPSKLLAFPNIGVDAATLPEGIVFTRERWFYTDYTERYDETDKKYIKLKPDEYYKSYWSLTEIAYGATDKLTVVANFWYFDAEIKSGNDIGKAKGIGDFYIFSKYKLFSIEKEPNSGIVGLLGLRLPTGDEKNMPILRLGDGSTDVGIGFAATKQWGRSTNSIFGGVWLNNKGDRAVDKRNEVEYRATSEYEFIPKKLNIQMELKGVWFEGNNERLLELVPGIQYTPVFPLTIQASCKVPVDAKGYFKYDYQIVLGVSFALPVYQKTVLQEPAKNTQP